MSIAASWPLQAALVAALKNDAPLTALLGGPDIFDTVPRGAALPYVVIGETRVDTRAASGADLARHEITLTIWSRMNGRKEVKQIMAAIRAALEAAPPDIAPHALLDFRFHRAGVSVTARRTHRLARLTFHALIDTP